MSWFCTFSLPFFCFKLYIFYPTIFSLFLVGMRIEIFENCEVHVEDVLFTEENENYVF